MNDALKQCARCGEINLSLLWAAVGDTMLCLACISSGKQSRPTLSTTPKQLPHLTSTARGTYHDAWGTPAYIIDAVREVYGPIDFDLASNRVANDTIQARYYSTRDRDRTIPFTRFPGHHHVWCNPPGPIRLVRHFWYLWASIAGAHLRGAFFAFNLGHVRHLPKPTVVPMRLLLLRKHVRFVGAKRTCSWPSGIIYTSRPGLDYGPLEALGSTFDWRT